MKEQELNLILGKYGCYVLCLKHIAEKELKHSLSIKVSDFEKWIKYGWIDEECFVRCPTEILRYWTRILWEVKKKYVENEKDVELIKGDYKVLCYSYIDDNHFIMYDYNSLEKSRCVECGVLSSVRVFKKV